MNLFLHQFKRELRAQRGLLIAWGIVLTLQGWIAASGWAGAFYRSQDNPVLDHLVAMLEMLAAPGIVLLPAAFALEDPPTDPEAHWQALPLRPGSLLTAKLLAVGFGVALPLLLIRVLILFAAGAGSWTGHTLLDGLSYLPSWMLLGFALGALCGTWKRFAITFVGLLVGTFLLEVVVSQLRGRVYAQGIQIFFSVFRDGLSDQWTNNFHLLGAITIVALRYATRFHPAAIGLAYVLVWPLGVVTWPVQYQSYLPDYPAPILTVGRTISVDYELPSRLLVVTNNGGARLQGHVPYSALKLQGIDAPGFLLPTSLDSTVIGVPRDGGPAEHFGPSTYRFPGLESWEPWDSDALDFMERHLTLSRAVPGLRIINPPFEPGEGVTLFDLHQPTRERYLNHRIDLTTHWRLTPGTYAPIGKLLLREGAMMQSDGTRLRIVAWRSDAGGLTQVKLNTCHVQLVTEEDNIHVRAHLDPRRRPANLRYLLVNKQRGEACLPTRIRSSTSRRIVPLAYQSTVVDYSIADGPDTDLAIPEDWLAEAELHIFRALYGVQTTAQSTREDIRILNLPLAAPPAKIEIKYR